MIHETSDDKLSQQWLEEANLDEVSSVDTIEAFHECAVRRHWAARNPNCIPTVEAAYEVAIYDFMKTQAKKKKKIWKEKKLKWRGFVFKSHSCRPQIQLG